MTSARFRLVMGLVIAVALALRLAAAIAHFDAPLAFDANDFDRHARSIASGNGYPDAVSVVEGPTALRPPAFPYVLAGLYRLRGQVAPPPEFPGYLEAGYEPGEAQVEAGRLGQAVVGTAIVALVALIAWQLWGRAAALASATLAALYPPLIILGVTLLSEPLFIALELAAVAAALEHRRSGGGVRWPLAAGALAGLATLTRSNGALLLVPLALLLWTRSPRWSARALAGPAAVMAACAVVVAPWTIRNAIVMEAFIPVSDQAGYTLAGTYNDSARNDPSFRAGWRPAELDPRNAQLIRRAPAELEMSRALMKAAREYILDHPAYVLEVGYRNAGRMLFLDAALSGRRGWIGEEGVSPRVADLGIAGFAVVAVLALLGAFTAAARRAPWPLWLAPALLATVVFVLPGNRFRAPVEPFLLLLAGAALAAGWERRGVGRMVASTA